MTLYSNALSWGAKVLEDIAGVSVVYHFDSNTSVGITTAVPERKSEQDEELQGNRIRSRSWSQTWLVDAALIKNGSTIVRPQLRHWLTHNGVQYRVQNPTGENVWEWVDAQRTRIRIHTVAGD